MSMIVRALKKQEAFRYLQSGRKTEKTAIEFLDQDVVPVCYHQNPILDMAHANIVMTNLECT